MSAYAEFLASKEWKPIAAGFAPGSLHSSLKPFQKECVRRACERGRAAIFADCGLGKTFMQLEWAREVAMHTGKPVLLLAPLAVGRQTLAEADHWDYPRVCVVRHQNELDEDTDIAITNYEMLSHFDSSQFGGIVLDESSILKSYSGKFRQEVTEWAENVDFRLCCSATPAPNDLIEITNHSEFLGVMNGKEVIAQFFIQDGNTTQKYRLRRHAVRPFYRWMASWATAVRMPSDLGDTDDGYVLPPLDVVQHTVAGQAVDGDLFAMEAQTLQERQKARKASIGERVAAAAAIASAAEGPVLVWCGLNDESKALTDAITDAIEVTGSDAAEKKTDALLGFSSGEHRVLVTKPSIGGWGMNWQHCNTMVFVGLSDSFEEYYQAVRRCWRFGQARPVTAHVICADTEGAVVRNIRRKQSMVETMMTELAQHMGDEYRASVKQVYHRPRIIAIPE